MKIIARKPKADTGNPTTEYIVVDRGEGPHMRYVSATADAHSLGHGEWYWGHYFSTLPEVMAHFDARPVSLGALTRKP